MLPFAMIIINAVDNRTPELWLDPVTATHRLLDDIKDAVENNPAFYRWALDWRDRNRQIDSTKDLLLAYYTDVKIVFVPDKGHPKLVYIQYHKLYQEIQDAVRRSEKRRRNSRHLLSSDQLNPYLQFAFEHFSRTLDVPFDFVRASSAFNEIQPHFNPILCLIKDYRAALPNSDVLDLFINVSPLVASSIMLDVVRRELKGISTVPFTLLPTPALPVPGKKKTMQLTIANAAKNFLHLLSANNDSAPQETPRQSFRDIGIVSNML